MNATETTPSADGEKLRQSALRDIQLARELINRARESMCNLEGRGYSTQYTALLGPWGKLDAIARRIRSLKPPTGVFRW